jgi:hypothetical protein
LSSLGGGTHSYSFKAKDTAGLESTVRVVEWLVISTIPKAQIISGPPDSRSNTAVFNLSCSVSACLYRFQLNGELLKVSGGDYSAFLNKSDFSPPVSRISEVSFL